ncbi:NADPH:quinone reductase [Micromonospora rosaria]|uniref:NADPH:quinone reductase n=1 Tax=Micromonospora rosaria TaxID=47874 RepID=A0A136PTM3_9ACTN|nr:quinone oxidoreductase [Micromonospora rosaria]KXK61850.1 NADPH:quinone reductase [Micromonospora rosaria]
MRVVTAREHGGSEVLRTEIRPDPVPGPGEVAVAVRACGVNFHDVYVRSGLYPGPLPVVPGLDGAGVVEAVGAGVTEVGAGDRVAWVDGTGGSYAERVVLPAARTVPVPDGVSLEQAAGVVLQGMTAHYLTHDTYRIARGDTVVVHAAAGGVGLLLVQVAKLRGASVVAVASTPDKMRLAAAAGADHVLHPGEDLAARVRGLTSGAGAAAVYDGVGRATFDASLASLRPRGTLALFGQSSGFVAPVAPQRLNEAGSVYLTRPNLVHYTADRAELLGRAGQVLRWLADGVIDLRIGGRYALGAAASAHAALESRRTSGKLLLIP